MNESVKKENQQHKEPAVFEIGTFRREGTRVVLDREQGIKAREKLDDLMENSDEVIVTVQPDIWAVNPSFLEELLSNAVTQLGKVEFERKFRFEPESDELNISMDVNEAVDRILTKNRFKAIY